MNKLILLLFTTVSVNIFGQTHSIGLQGGKNFTNIISKTTLKDTKLKTGISAGINYEFSFSGKWLLGADLLYTQQGHNDEIIFSDENGTPTGNSITSSNDYNYLSIPLKFGYSYGNKFRGFAKIGLCPSFLLKAEIQIPPIDLVDHFESGSEINVTNSVTKFDLAALAEIGIGYRFGNKIDLFTSTSIKYSLTTYSNADYFPKSYLRHYGFSWTFGVRYILNPGT